jgi:NADH:ubiquinone oxidoreductase subunit C
MTFTQAFSAIKKLSAAGDERSYPQLNEKQILLSPDQLLPAVQILLENEVYHLSTITGVYQDEQLYFLYHFWEGEGLTLRIPVDHLKDELQTLTHLIPGALFYEREIAEMFGVHINGLDTSQKMFLPDNWEGGAPMRKESPSTSENAKSEDQ